MNRQIFWPAAIAAAFLSCATFPAQAQDNGNRVGGSVTAVDAAAKTVTVTNRRDQSSTTFKVSDSTKYTVGVLGAMSDLKVGGSVRVMGRPSDDDDNTINAFMIQIIAADAPAPAGGGGGGGRFGTTGKIATLPPAMTVTTEEGTKKVTTTDQTRVMSSKSGGLDDIKVGVNVFATLDDKSVATDVRVTPAGLGFGGRRGGGGGGQGGGGGAGGGQRQRPAGGGGAAPTQ